MNYAVVESDIEHNVHDKKVNVCNKPLNHDIRLKYCQRRKLGHKFIRAVSELEFLLKCPLMAFHAKSSQCVLVTWRRLAA